MNCNWLRGCLPLILAIIVGCTSDDKEISKSFKTPLKLGSEWTIYERTEKKIIYINQRYQSTDNGQRRFNMVRRANDITSHKEFVKASKSDPNFKDLDLNTYSYMRTDELVDCNSGAWITERHYLVDRNGVDMTEIDGRDLDDNVYRITPQIWDIICK